MLAKLSESPYKIKDLKKYYKKKEKKFKDIQSIKYMNEIYSISDNIILTFTNKFKNSTYKFHGKIKEIKYQQKKKKNIFICILKIQYYFEKEYLPSNYLKYHKEISVNELFLSNLEEFVNITNLFSKFKMVSLDYYLKSVEDVDLKFNLASFDYNNGKILPKLSKRKKICFCNKIENPDFDYIFCEGCKKWFHYGCVGLENVDNISNLNFKCSKCRAQ